MTDNIKEQKPYMALIGASRVSHSPPGAALFDSETRHQHYIVLRIKAASRRRSHSRDWVHGEEHYIEVAMSEAQWAAMISTLNRGDGTPCTLQWLRDEGQIEPPHGPDDRMALFHDEMLDTLQRARDKLAELKDAPGLTKARIKEIELIEQDLNSNTKFVADQFGEHMEHFVSKAKTEVEAYMNAAIQRAGLTALGAPEKPTHTPTKKIEKKDE